MESLDYWRLCDELSIVHAALLTVGVDPSSEEGANCDRWKEHEQPKGYLAVKSAMIRAIMAESLPAKLRYWDEPDCRTEPAMNWCESSVSVDDLKTWLRSHGFTSGFFFQNEEAGTPGYLDPKNPRYSPKLAAAVSAWLAVEDAAPGKSAKQTLERWLRERAAGFGLADEDGNPVNQAMTECSTVANWQTGGGPGKTPG
ncbi:hypothetical protein [uncultured Sphaerotilus sp.]|uniref:hypothetical protein n=1 Tax=uncultured Sphaerotilus sp. TaxID=474984 RepID=UPI0030CA4756